ANAFRFVAIKSRGFDRVFQFGQRRVGIIFRRAVFPEQHGRDHVDAFVGGLCRENCGYEELKRVTKIQLAMRGWINLWPGFQKLRHALASGHPLLFSKPAVHFNWPLEVAVRSQFHQASANSSSVNSDRHDTQRLGFIAAWATEMAKWRQPQEPLFGEPLSQTISSFVLRPG